MRELREENFFKDLSINKNSFSFVKSLIYNIRKKIYIIQRVKQLLPFCSRFATFVQLLDTGIGYLKNVFRNPFRRIGKIDVTIHKRREKWRFSRKNRDRSYLCNWNSLLGSKRDTDAGSVRKIVYINRGILSMSALGSSKPFRPSFPPNSGWEKECRVHFRI